MKCPKCGKSLWFLKSYCAFCKTPLTEEGKRLLQVLAKEDKEKLQRHRASKGDPGEAGLVTFWEATPQEQSSSSEGTTPKSPLFYFRLHGEEKGPYTIRQLTSMWYGGQITADALYRASASSEWVPMIARFD